MPSNYVNKQPDLNENNVGCRLFLRVSDFRFHGKIRAQILCSENAQNGELIVKLMLRSGVCVCVCGGGGGLV